MNNIFIDCGGYDGCSVRKFRKLYDPNNEYHVYTFEPNPLFFNDYGEFVNHTLIKKACYIEYNKNVILNLDTKNYDGSSIMDKTNIKKYNSSMTVESIDFVSWLIELINQVNKDCNIIIKMDIEGAEYPILEKLLLYKDYIIYIKKLFIEWHWNRMSDRVAFKIRHDNIVNKLNNFQIPMKKWNALSYKTKNNFNS